MLGAVLLVVVSRAGSDPPPAARCLMAAKPAARWALPPRFREVSGLALTPDGKLLLHNDEEGLVAVFDPATGLVSAVYQLGAKLAKGDFEGIAIGDGRIFLTTSDGNFLNAPLPVPGTPSGVLPASMTETGLGEHCEIEGLAFERRTHLLLFACKSPREKKLAGEVTIYRWSVADGRLADPKRLEIPLASLPGRLARSFRPSSLDLDPRTGDYVVISSADHGFLVLDPGGKLTAAGDLPRHHRQPEGLAIAPDGRLFISDEGGRSRGTITAYGCR